MSTSAFPGFWPSARPRACLPSCKTSSRCRATSSGAPHLPVPFGCLAFSWGIGWRYFRPRPGRSSVLRILLFPRRSMADSQPTSEPLRSGASRPPQPCHFLTYEIIRRRLAATSATLRGAHGTAGLAAAGGVWARGVPVASGRSGDHCARLHPARRWSRWGMVDSSSPSMSGSDWKEMDLAMSLPSTVATGRGEFPRGTAGPFRTSCSSRTSNGSTMSADGLSEVCRRRNLYARFGTGSLNITVFKWAFHGAISATSTVGRVGYPPDWLSSTHDFAGGPGSGILPLQRPSPVSIARRVFVECVGGDLTAHQVRTTPRHRRGIYAEPVEDRHQGGRCRDRVRGLDHLVLLRIPSPCRNRRPLLHFQRSSRSVVRVDSIPGFLRATAGQSRRLIF